MRVEQENNDAPMTTFLGDAQMRLNYLRADLTDALFEIDTIELQVNPHLLNAYRIQIGCYENELLKSQIAARRARRKLAIAQAHANRNERINDKELESILDAEFAQWETQLSSQIAQYMEALENRQNSRPLTPWEEAEIKHLHRTLIKRLHPDINVGHERECDRFFLIAQAAYETGDLVALRSVEVATAHLGKSPRKLASLDDMNAEIVILETEISIAKQRLQKLKSSHPYLLKEKLGDPCWVASTISSLKERIDEQNRAKERLEEAFHALKEAGNE